jgi:hypothetical protein
MLAGIPSEMLRSPNGEFTHFKSDFALWTGSVSSFGRTNRMAASDVVG